jgi:hypothetical protein
MRAAVTERAGSMVVCELIVPGSARTGPEVYIDALLARMPDGQRAATLAAVGALAGPASRGTLAERQFSPEFAIVRVADGSVVPRTLSVNPSLTIMALAERLADYLLTGDHGYFRQQAASLAR